MRGGFGEIHDSWPAYPFYPSAEYKSLLQRLVTELGRHVRGYPKEKQAWLKPGDALTTTIEKLGTLRFVTLFGHGPGVDGNDTSYLVDGRTLASLSVAGKVIFLRTDSHLYRIEQR